MNEIDIADPIVCLKSDFVMAELNASRIYNRASLHYGASTDQRLSSIQKQAHSETFSKIVPMAIQSRFLIADTALEVGCYDIADRNYRKLIEDYTGARYQAYRERARIGVDDIRGRQKK